MSFHETGNTRERTNWWAGGEKQSYLKHAIFDSKYPGTVLDKSDVNLECGGKVRAQAINVVITLM